MFTGIVEELGTVHEVSPIREGPQATARLLEPRLEVRAGAPGAA